ncbi:helicase [Sphingorhabdus sp. IMCC26285]|uniref:Helicase n=2 Tax=Sphingorhabdus profundilacus TaxID=2509718 RepID=A0A6I4M4D7_9SPHN|nr:helicase [Sphingorhabdus profundilacus]
MCAHSSGMIGFPLRLLAREIYDRVVAIKGVNQVALITGEERIEPPHARWYCCTVESMPVQKDFAFVAIDEGQLGADPERGHIFTDRILHARGREETMILGSESLRPLIRTLLAEAEIISRPRFSVLSYAGTKKLSRLPKRSAIVAFSIEQVYAVAETLRRMRGGAAVVMGALSPRTRNAQVAMFQSGEVDYLVATDAIGMGLNLDVSHVAFASLSKFDGTRRRRLTVAEMAQIAGRAGRHQRDGSFGTLAGEGSEFSPEEVLAIENHEFPRLDWLYWRDAEPRLDSVATLIADLESRPDRPGLMPAPRAIDLSVLKRLSEMPDVQALIRHPVDVARLWEVASLPDFRQMGEEHHSRFVGSLWHYLGQGDRVLPQSLFAGELARLDNIQGDVDTLSARIAGVRTWTYIAHRIDWLADPAVMAERARALETKLSDALHDALRQRFVDRRTAMLLRKTVGDSALFPVEIDGANRVLVDGEDIGTLQGFSFRVDPSAKAGDRKLLLAAAERHLTGLLRQKARDVAMAEDSDFALASDGDGKPAILWKGEPLGLLTKGRSLMQPVFTPVKAVAGLEGDALREIAVRAESWIETQLAKAMGGIVGLQQLSQQADVDGNVRALAVQLAEAGGIAGRHYLADAIAALPKDARGAARKGGIVFGALDIYHHAALKPAAAKWRAALFAARDGRSMPQLPPESAVHLKEWKFAHPGEARNAGYRRVGDEYVRIDLAERVIKKAHEARGQVNSFSMDMAFATSLGLSDAGLKALMRDAGFRYMEAPAEKAETQEELDATAVQCPVSGNDQDGLVIHDQTESEGATPDNNPVDAMQAVPLAQPVHLTHWRWVGLPKPRPQEQRTQRARPVRPKPKDTANSKANPERVPPKAKDASPPSALALQLAALKGLKF